MTRLVKVVDGKLVEMTEEEEARSRAENACVQMKTVKALTDLLVAKGIITQTEVDAALKTQSVGVVRG
ncbi:hypothetical protein FHP25_25045 [Vineibacter terrae]|uniref:Uncharacterized protein n=1 Tax=Vineibacter terrae TaxID=2586908 RepID=A0A5C8PG13_9HYPH|nr:nitrile hydratase subunit alpha [Vineibacter terrae]TXL72566.1 hypothetical protein FHP25_25045 [Vineibacter terrae]